MKTTIKNITKKAIIGLTIAGISITFGGCGDSAPVSKPKSDAERYDDAYNDMEKTVNELKAYDIKQVNDYINKDPKYRMLELLHPNTEKNEFQPKGIEIKQIGGNNSTDAMHKIKIYTKAETTAAVEAIDNIINSEDRKKLINKLDEDQKTMKEIASKAQNNQASSMMMKYDSDIRTKVSISSSNYYPFLLAQEQFNKMNKFDESSDFWKQ